MTATNDDILKALENINNTLKLAHGLNKDDITLKTELEEKIFSEK